jgi:hypothetical protein
MSNGDLPVIFGIGLFIGIRCRGVNGERAKDLGLGRRTRDPDVSFGGIQCSCLTLITVECKTAAVIY